MKAVSGKEFAQALEAKGWTLKRINGSHHIYAKEGNPARISIPVHGSTPLKKGLVSHLIKVADLKPEDF